MQIKALIESEALKASPSKEILAANTKSVKILEKLSNDSDPDVLCCVASNPNCPVEILERLSNDPYWPVRANVVINLNCSVEILERLSNDCSYYVRYYVKQNPNFPINTF